MADSADAPPQRVPGHCSPRRPDETTHDHFVRCKAHRDAWRQQFLDDYYKQKETRLPSPNSEDDLDEEGRLEVVRFIERCIRLESGHPEPGDLPTRVEWPRVEYPPGKSLSEISEYEPSPWSPIQRRRPEDDEYDPRPIFQSPSPVPRPDSTPTRKRSSSPAEEDAHKPQAKKRRTDTDPEVSPAEPSRSGQKRKTLQDEGLDEPQVARDQTGSSAKRRKTDTHYRPAPASMTPTNKRKRESNTDEVLEHEVQASSQQGREVTGVKRRRVDEETTINDAGDWRCRNRKSRNARGKTAPTSSSRVTRARRRQLSEKDAELFQLGQRGQLDLQKVPEAPTQHHDTEARGSQAATERPRRRRSATKPEPKASDNTNDGAKTRVANTTTTSTDTHSKTRSRVGKKTNTKAGASTKARRARSNR